MGRINLQQQQPQERETWRNFLRVRSKIEAMDKTISSLTEKLAAAEAQLANIAAATNPAAGEDGEDGEDSVATAVYSGEAEIDFGAAPGSDIAERTVSADWVASGSIISAWVSGNRSTADNNAYEHWIAPVIVRVTEIDPGTGFTLSAYSDQRLEGSYVVHWQGI